MKVGDFVLSSCNYEYHQNDNHLAIMKIINENHENGYYYLTQQISFYNKDFIDRAERTKGIQWGVNKEHLQPLSIYNKHLAPIINKCYFHSPYKEELFSFLRERIYAELGFNPEALIDVPPEFGIGISLTELISVVEGPIQEDLSTYKPKVTFIGGP